MLTFQITGKTRWRHKNCAGSSQFSLVLSPQYSVILIVQFPDTRRLLKSFNHTNCPNFRHTPLSLGSIWIENRASLQKPSWTEFLALEVLNNALFYSGKTKMRSLGRELSMEAIVEREQEEEDEGGQHKWTEFCTEFAWSNIWFQGKEEKVFRGWTDIGENFLLGLFFGLLSLFDVGSDSWSAWRFLDTTLSPIVVISFSFF